MKDIYINKDVIKNVDELSVYCAISYLSNSSMDEVIFNTDMILYTLYGTMDVTRRNLDATKKGISSLLENADIKLIQEYKGTYVIKNTFIVDGSVGNFITFSLDEVRRIHNINFKNKKELFRYFLFLVSTIHNIKKCGWYSIEAIRNELEIRKDDTIIEYNSILEKNKLIYIHRTTATVKDFNDNYSRINNTYGRYEDIEMIAKHAKEYIGLTYTLNDKNTKPINTRSISKQYNDFIKGIFKGDVNKLKVDCEKYNSYYSNVAGAKLKDMNVFDSIETEEYDEPIIYFNKQVEQNTKIKCVENQIVTDKISISSNTEDTIDTTPIVLQGNKVLTVKNWCNSVVENIGEYSFNEDMFLQELRYAMNGDTFNTIDDNKAMLIYVRLYKWVRENDIEEEDVLPF